KAPLRLLSLWLGSSDTDESYCGGSTNVSAAPIAIATQVMAMILPRLRRSSCNVASASFPSLNSPPAGGGAQNAFAAPGGGATVVAGEAAAAARPPSAGRDSAAGTEIGGISSPRISAPSG